MNVLIVLADGVEEMEAVILIDVLRRAEWHVVAAGLKPGPVEASRQVKLIPDAVLEDVDVNSFDMLILPGGGQGTNVLMEDERVLALLRTFAAEKKMIAAICAAPHVLQKAGLLAGRKATCYPGLLDKLTGAREQSRDRVVQDGTIITSQGPGTAFEMALHLVAVTDGKEKAEGLAEDMVL